ncbi:MAG: C26 family cysteine hydrolase domain-containing family [Deltaproteobacteria bacterium]|nr:C26 family cysteine hydrolase domain-containing family [Deltaproteobacteria bacterium]
MRIGILQCDATNENFRDEHGDYPGMFISLFQSIDPALEFTVFDVRLGQYPQTPQECDAYLITGSRFSVYDDEAWIHKLEKFVVELHSEKHPLLGICFGHQMIARALGGKTEKAAQGWGVGVQSYRKTKTKSWLNPALENFSLLAVHQDQVTELPEGAELIAESEFCPNAAFMIDDHILTFQAHPEFEKAYSKVLLVLREQILGPEIFAAGVKSLDQSIQPQVITNWMVNFLRNGESS